MFWMNCLGGKLGLQPLTASPSGLWGFSRLGKAGEARLTKTPKYDIIKQSTEVPLLLDGMQKR